MGKDLENRERSVSLKKTSHNEQILNAPLPVKEQKLVAGEFVKIEKKSNTEQRGVVKETVVHLSALHQEITATIVGASPDVKEKHIPVSSYPATSPAPETPTPSPTRPSGGSFDRNSRRIKTAPPPKETTPPPTNVIKKRDADPLPPPRVDKPKPVVVEENETPPRKKPKLERVTPKAPPVKDCGCK